MLNKSNLDSVTRLGNEKRKQFPVFARSSPVSKEMVRLGKYSFNQEKSLSLICLNAQKSEKRMNRRKKEHKGKNIG